MSEIKLSDKQKEVIKLMREGWILIIGQGEYSGRIYQAVTKGFDNVYFNATVFSNLLSKELIYQQNRHPFDYVLTSLGKSIKL